MTNSNASAKSRGVVLFAFNTNFDYVEIARRSAQLITHILKLPVTLITDQLIEDQIFDHVIQIDNQLENSQPGLAYYRSWRNGNRYQAYELSPYDETLLLDADYLVLSTNLVKLFEQDFDYRLMTHNQIPSSGWNETMGATGLQYQWATVILFRKTEKAKMLFDMAGRVQRNYRYYVSLYQMSRSNFRNDYAFTIANNILNGYDQGMADGIPWTMLSLTNLVTSITLKNKLITVKEPNTAHVIPQIDIHVADKEYLLTDNFKDFLDTVCAN
jgi:hypothetical protein